MDSNKVYKDIVYLLYNILNNEKLRYELYKDQNYRDLYIQLVNDLLTLEKEDKCVWEKEQWATTFGKAIVVISNEKQRFERQDNKKIEKIYEDYSKLISQSVNAFEVKRDSLTNDKGKFSKEDVLYNGKIDEATITKYDELAKEEMKAESTKKADDNIFVNDADKKAKPGDEKNNQQGYGPQGFNPFGQGPSGAAFGQMPISPMQDPRFYPYNKKPKFMPALKITLGVIVCLAAVLLIIANIFAMTKTINLTRTDDLGKLGTLIVNSSSDMKKAFPNVFPDGGTIPNFGTLIGKYPDSFNVTLGLDGQSNSTAMRIVDFIFYGVAAAYVGWACFRKPRNLSEKYRISYWPIVFMVIFFGLSIIGTYRLANQNEMKSIWKSTISSWIDDKTFDSTFSSWWDDIKSAKNTLAVSILMDISIGFLGLSVILGIAVCCLNPKLDKVKYQRAQQEYTNAMMSAMQGIPYEMDPSLFENDDDVIIHNKSKFTLWWEKVWNKLAFWKHKKNNKKDK